MFWILNLRLGMLVSQWETHSSAGKKSFVSRVSKNYNLNERLCSTSDRICTIFSHTHGVVWCIPPSPKKNLQITAKSSLSLSCLSAKIVTVCYCSRLDKRQLSNHMLPLRKTVAVNTNTLEMATLSCYLMQKWDIKHMNIDGSLEA